MKFVCHITGDEIEWGNTTSSSNRIRLDLDNAIGSPVTRGPISAVITSKETLGIRSEYRINVTPGAQFGYTRVYCEDREDDGNRVYCAPTAITPGNAQHSQMYLTSCMFYKVSKNHESFNFVALPSSPTNLLLISANTNIATVQWSPPSTDVSVTSYSITITPAPGTGTCSGGFCTVSTQDCPMSSSSCDFAITDLQYGQSYNVSVRSMNCRGSSSSILVQFVLQNPPTTGSHVLIIISS